MENQKRCYETSYKSGCVGWLCVAEISIKTSLRDVSLLLAWLAIDGVSVNPHIDAL
jgi:hypothetical protein